LASRAALQCRLPNLIRVQAIEVHRRQVSIQQLAPVVTRGWIANRRRLERIVDRMEEVSAAAVEIVLRQPATTEDHSAE
jgi:hypothetical protein